MIVVVASFMFLAPHEPFLRLQASLLWSMCMSHALLISLISACLNFYFAPIYLLLSQLPWHAHAYYYILFTRGLYSRVRFTAELIPYQEHWKRITKVVWLWLLLLSCSLLILAPWAISKLLCCDLATCMLSHALLISACLNFYFSPIYLLLSQLPWHIYYYILFTRTWPLFEGAIYSWSDPLPGTLEKDH